jgi:broad specificity phosphatase PhoE
MPTVPTTRMLLIRHGDSYSKSDGVYAGPRACRGLTDLGREQTARLRERLLANAAKPEAVYCSPIHRAEQTGAILAEAFPPLEPVRDCGLCSYHLDDALDGVSWDRIRSEFQHRNEAGRPDGGVFVPFEEGNESWAELVARVGRALTGIAARHSGGTVIAAMHKESVEASLIAFGALPLHRGFDVEIRNASITEWATEDDPATPWDLEHPRGLPVRWRLSRFNDCAHLED